MAADPGIIGIFDTTSAVAALAVQWEDRARPRADRRGVQPGRVGGI